MFLVLFFSFACTIFSTSYLIPLFKRIQNEGQPIREEGPKSHLVTKKGTPTMGGIAILLSIIVSVLLFSKINMNLLTMLCVVIGYTIIGGIDDYQKLVKRKGISAKIKLGAQFVIVLASLFMLDVSSEIILPFGYNIDLGFLYYPLAVIAIVSYSNAVNVTDGLDGLVTVPIILASVCLAIISINYEVSILCYALIGACLGFLFFNANPAKIFMGDIGSLPIGALLGIMSIITKCEVIFIIIAGLFVVEALSVVIQVYYFKLSGGKRVFRMAPIHHHFEQLGWQENTIVMRFWIFAVLCAAIGMAVI